MKQSWLRIEAGPVRKAAVGLPRLPAELGRMTVQKAKAQRLAVLAREGAEQPGSVLAEVTVIATQGVKKRRPGGWLLSEATPAPEVLTSEL